MSWRTKFTVAGTAVALLSGASVLAPSAQAATGPKVTGGSCSETSYAIQCVVAWSGGTDPSSVVWTAVANSSISTYQTNPVTHTSIGAGNCVPGTFYTVKATITDAAGVSISATFGGGRC